MKGGQSFPIRSVIQWVTPPPDPSTSASMRSQENIGGGVMGNATTVMGGARNGGLGSGTNTGMTVTGGMIQLTPKQTEGLSSVADYGVQAPTQTAGPSAAGAGSHAVVAVEAGESIPHATGVSGVMLAEDASGKISGTFSAVKQNVHLDGGTRILLALAAIK
jgi:hypothetical protein